MPHPERATRRGETTEGPSDEEVVARVLAGDTRLFEVIMRRHNQRLYRVARAILRDEAEAEDVMQQAYVEAYVHLAQFAGRSLFSTWLTKIAVYEALRRARRRGRDARVRAGEGLEEDAVNKLEARGPSPEEQAHARQVRGLLESAIDALPRIYRSVFVLREIEGLSTAETASCLRLRQDAVKTRLSRARAMLRDELLERAGAASPSVFSFHLSRCDRVVAGVLQAIELAPPPTIH
jgi:RNA polymerase sigma-70 factor (ECF subfamily)